MAACRPAGYPRLLKPAELRGIRRRLGLTQLEMAKQLQVSLTQYGAYENGRAPIRRILEYAVRWLEYLSRRP